MSSGGKGGKASGAQTVTTTNTPWSEAVPYIQEQMKAAQDIFKNQPPSQYPGLSVAQRSFPTMLAEELTLGRALQGSPITDAARNDYLKTVSGDYLDPTKNPAFQSGVNAVQDKYNETVAPQTDAAFARSGAFGGSAHRNQVGINQRELSRGLNDVAAGIYNQERARQFGAVDAAPQYARNDFMDFAPIAQVGAQRDAYNQSLLDDAVNKYGFDANKSRQALSEYISFINGAAGNSNTQTQTTPMYQNKAAGVLGGALSGAQLASSLGAGSSLPWLSGSIYGPMGLGLGAAAGGLLSLF